jgi:ATP-dependent Zn protease
MWDEVDSIVDRRIGERNSKAWWTSFVNGVLTLVDCLPAGTILIGACNHPEIVDPALKRSGRLDSAVAIPLPDAPSREGILRVHLRGDLADADLTRIVHAIHGQSGADIARYVRDARQRARDKGGPLTLADLEFVILPPETRSPDVLARCAIHEAAHAVVATALGLDVEAVTLHAMGSTGGSTSVVAGRDPIPTRATLELEVIGALAGRAADLAGSGANAGAGGCWSSDLGFATQILARIHGSLGLGSSLVFRGSPDEVAQVLAHDADLRDVVEADLVRLLNRAMTLVEHHANAIAAVADALIQERLLTGDDVLAIMAAHPPWKRPRRHARPAMDFGRARNRAAKLREI